ncbi:hypothetical protein P7C70_g5899, partial [Phenoliferia sp. Uapishka_3]
MPSLKMYIHAHPAPIPTLVAKALQSKPTLNAIRIEHFAVDSLPSLLCLCPLESIYFDATERDEEAPVVLLPHAPLTVESECRRNGEPPSVAQWKKALVSGLARLFLKSRDHLQQLFLAWCPEVEWLGDLILEIKRLGGPLTLFPALRRIRLSSDGRGTGKSRELKALLAMAPNVEQVCFQGGFKGLVVLPADVKTLKSVHLNIFPGSDSAAALRGVFASSNVEDLEIAPVRLPIVRAVFAPGLLGHSVTKLELYVTDVSGSSFKLADLRHILAACPHLDIFALGVLKCGWAVSMVCLLLACGERWCSADEDGSQVDVIKELSRGAPSLREFIFDHPWEDAPVGQVPFQHSDGRTIRSDKYANFRVLSVTHGSVAAEVIHRIRSDVAAVTPVYQRRFRHFAKVCPRLEKVTWFATLEVDWVWEFLRWPGEMVKISQSYEVNYQGSPDDAIPGTGQKCVVMRP